MDEPQSIRFEIGSKGSGAFMLISSSIYNDIKVYRVTVTARCMTTEKIVDTEICNVSWDLLEMITAGLVKFQKHESML